MKVILLRDIAKIGRRNSVIEVPDGHALNQLIPKKWAEAATPVNLKKLAKHKSDVEIHDQNDQVRFEAVAATLSVTPLQVEVLQVNDQGHLFKAVKEEDIVAAARVLNIVVERSDVVIESPIKSVGSHAIVLKRGTKKISCTVEVIKKA